MAHILLVVSFDRLLHSLPQLLLLKAVETRWNLNIATNSSVPPQLRLHTFNAVIVDRLPLEIQDRLELLEFPKSFIGILLLSVCSRLFLSHVGNVCVRILLAEVAEGVAFINFTCSTPQMLSAIIGHVLHIIVHIWVQPCAVQQS